MLERTRGGGPLHRSGPRALGALRKRLAAQRRFLEFRDFWRAWACEL